VDGDGALRTAYLVARTGTLGREAGKPGWGEDDWGGVGEAQGRQGDGEEAPH